MFTRISAAALLVCGSAFAADLPLEFVAADEKARAAIPLGGDFQPEPKQPVFVAIDQSI